jgi:hypothetical protein
MGTHNPTYTQGLCDPNPTYTHASENHNPTYTHRWVPLTHLPAYMLLNAYLGILYKISYLD